MEKSQTTNNFSKKDLFSKVINALTAGALLTSAGIAVMNHKAQKNKDRELKKKFIQDNYLSTRINPRTMRIEPVRETLNRNFSLLSIPGVVGLIGSTAAVIGADRVIDHVTSPEFRAKRKIDKKMESDYNLWYESRLNDYKNGVISKEQFDAEKDIMKKKMHQSKVETYERWKAREEFIKDASRTFYENLQTETPMVESNFSLIPSIGVSENPFQTKISPDVVDFLKLDVGRSLLKGGSSLLKNFMLKEDKIRDAVKRWLLIEFKIDSFKNIPSVKKEEMKFEAFKSILAEFKNPEDIEKIFKLKEKYEKEIKSKKASKNNNT